MRALCFPSHHAEQMTLSVSIASSNNENESRIAALTHMSRYSPINNGFFVRSLGVPSALRYRKRNGFEGPASYIALNPARVQVWHILLTSARSTPLDLIGVTAAVLFLSASPCNIFGKFLPYTCICPSKFGLHIFGVVLIVADDDTL